SFSNFPVAWESSARVDKKTPTRFLWHDGARIKPRSPQRRTDRPVDWIFKGETFAIGPTIGVAVKRIAGAAVSRFEIWARAPGKSEVERIRAAYELPGPRRRLFLSIADLLATTGRA